MKFTCIGRLGKVSERSNGEYVSFGVAEPSYKDTNGDYVTPWVNFLVKGDSPTAKFLKNNAEKIQTVVVYGNEREVTKNDVTNYYHNVTSVEVVSWIPSDEVESDNDDNLSQSEYPWSKEDLEGVQG